MYKIQLSRKSAKFYQTADTVTTRRLDRVFSVLSDNPYNHYNIKRLVGDLAGSLRFRLGDMRIIYSVNDDKQTVYIEVIRFRGDAYKA
jgi:mRNA interferase RelE/StbE